MLAIPTYIERFWRRNYIENGFTNESKSLD